MPIIAAVMPAPRVPVELREFPEPALEDGSVLLQTTFSEVCGTDVHIWHGRLAGVPHPIIPGHVSVGVAAKVRGRVRGADGADVHEGDTLAFFDVHRTCGRYVIAGQYTDAGSSSIDAHQALSDAEAMRLPKALVQPN